MVMFSTMPSDIGCGFQESSYLCVCVCVCVFVCLCVFCGGEEQPGTRKTQAQLGGDKYSKSRVRGPADKIPDFMPTFAGHQLSASSLGFYTELEAFLSHVSRFQPASRRQMYVLSLSVVLSSSHVSRVASPRLASPLLRLPRKWSPRWRRRTRTRSGRCSSRRRRRTTPTCRTCSSSSANGCRSGSRCRPHPGSTSTLTRPRLRRPAVDGCAQSAEERASPSLPSSWSSSSYPCLMCYRVIFSSLANRRRQQQQQQQQQQYQQPQQLFALLWYGPPERAELSLAALLFPLFFCSREGRGTKTSSRCNELSAFVCSCPFALPPLTSPLYSQPGFVKRFRDSPL